MVSSLEMQKPIIVSLSHALFILEAGLLWDQKDVFLIKYWGRLHLQVQLYGLLFMNISAYIWLQTQGGLGYLWILNKRDHEKEIYWVTPVTNSEFYCCWANKKFNTAVPVFIVMHFSALARCSESNWKAPLMS